MPLEAIGCSVARDVPGSLSPGGAHPGGGPGIAATARQRAGTLAGAARPRGGLSCVPAGTMSRRARSSPRSLLLSAATVPGGSAVSYVDTHCHLDHHEQLGAAEQVERARAAGVTAMITVGTDMASSTQAVRTARRFDGVWAAVGVHPNDAMEATPHVLEVIDRLAREDEVVAVGETGLDYYRDHTTPAQQEAAFRAHIELAREHARPWSSTAGRRGTTASRSSRTRVRPTGSSCTATPAISTSPGAASRPAGTCPSPAT
jgi:hypothetical protein